MFENIIDHGAVLITLNRNQLAGSCIYSSYLVGQLKLGQATPVLAAKWFLVVKHMYGIQTALATGWLGVIVHTACIRNHESMSKRGGRIHCNALIIQMRLVLGGVVQYTHLQYIAI